MFKKMSMFSSMALALVALAAPVSALGNWTQGGIPLEAGEDPHVFFSGPAAFSVPASGAGWSTDFTVTVELTGGTTEGHVKSFTADNCKGIGPLAGLACTSTITAGIVDCIGGQLVITGVTVHNKYYSPLDPGHNSPVREAVLTGDFDATPDNSEAISTVTLSSSNAQSGGAPATLTGSLAVTPAGEFGC